MLFNIPIEPLEERYSAQWIKWFDQEFKEHCIDCVNIMGETLTDTIETGSFLDVCGTNYYKASQLMKISRMIHNEEITDGDILLFHDLWFPGLEMIAYMRDGMGLSNLHIAGIIHAGTYDPYDFLYKQGMSHWGKKLEESWFRIIDQVFVATKFHKRLLVNSRDIDPKKVHITGLPIYYYPPVKPVEKENIVVFPHRLDSEKNPNLFDMMTQELARGDWRFIKSKNVCKNKQEYFDLLHKSKIAVSFADQETWGIAQQEALFAGCFPVVPNRLSYSEMYPPIFQYASFKEALDLVEEMMIESNQVEFEKARRFTDHMLQEKGRSAIWTMLESMGY